MQGFDCVLSPPFLPAFLSFSGLLSPSPALSSYLLLVVSSNLILLVFFLLVVLHPSPAPERRASVQSVITTYPWMPRLAHGTNHNNDISTLRRKRTTCRRIHDSHHTYISWSASPNEREATDIDTLRFYFATVVQALCRLSSSPLAQFFWRPL